MATVSTGHVDAIVVGDWIVYDALDRDPDAIECGQIVELDGLFATIVWDGSGREVGVNLGANEISVYGSESAAREAANEAEGK
jgi:hypothetical protein